ncbi:DUF2971 domain-containing protein [Clostridium botulinum]|uniref:DUF2971 domain-containing protein n=1 Tax=Clostridium botulinum TaxID=1491 RepID=UPI000AD98DD5|nr:DUF2971 domain-containing protein [Clostridium botulinum]MBY6930904.1 DUF2971 domain-containing protein [Clostridium botulinum]NFG21133.1 DUF2971 domain-containing protein [Clostridium botulinum]NFO80009.1 DUF2971 domain-containing protein [Clostridium botulinum]
MKREEWKKRIARRSDMTCSLVHLTKDAIIDGKELTSTNVLIKILKDRKLIGSTTESGFIVGDRNAVCFQESPLHSLAENIYFENDLLKNGESSKVRYTTIGLLFEKTLIYRAGGRPVIYDKTSEAKQYLPRDQWWRIVNFDLSNNENFIDWTHEREWRVPDDFTFNLEDVTLLVGNLRGEKFSRLLKKLKEENIDINKIKGIIPLTQILS